MTPSDVITRTKAASSGEVLAEMDRVKDVPLRATTADGRCARRCIAELGVFGLCQCVRRVEGISRVAGVYLLTTTLVLFCFSFSPLCEYGEEGRG